MSIVQSLRDYTIQEMKPEMGPWAEEYTVRMEDIETQIRFEKGRHSHDNPVTSNYSELFPWPGGYRQYLQEEDLSEPEKLLQAYNRKMGVSAGSKILLSGDEGTGKTVLCKKLAYDWAQGKFVRFSIVF